MGASLTATTLVTHSSAPALAALDTVSWHAALRQYGAEWVEDVIDAATSATVDGMLPLVRIPVSTSPSRGVRGVHEYSFLPTTKKSACWRAESLY
jgi:hypothetical protein